MISGLVSIGCNKGEQADQPFSGVGARPDVLPVMLNKDLPFRYPPAIYTKKVQATGWKPKLTIEQGVVRTVRWLQDNRWVYATRK